MSADADQLPESYRARVEAILGRIYPSYKEPLAKANELLEEGYYGARAAVEVFRALREDFPTELKVGERLVLALLEAGELDAAKEQVTALEKDFNLSRDEETLCRLGRLHRDVGEKLWTGSPPDPGGALAEFELAWGFYDRGFALRHGHYPGINRAGLYVLRAALSPPDRRPPLLAGAKAAAGELLQTRPSWPLDYPDDNIWHAATEAEALLLTGRPAEAVAKYRAALGMPNAKPFHRGGVIGQLKRLRAALGTAGALAPDELAALDAEIAGLDQLAPG
jgi:hypothetical protein